jgi:hypothetical protein
MIPTLFFYELGLVALVWLFLMLYWLWPNDPATRYPTRPQLRVPRKRSNAPKLFVGLPHRADRKFKGPFRSAGRPSPALPAGVSAVPTALAAPLAGARRMGAGAVSGLPSRAGGRKIANGGRTSGPCPAPGKPWALPLPPAPGACGTSAFFRCAPSIVVIRSPLPYDRSEGPITTNEASNMPLQRSLRSSTVHIWADI